MSYTIGIDLGTTNTKVIALTEEGRILFEDSCPTTVTAVPSGGEMDPRRLSADLYDILRKTLSACRNSTNEPLAGIGLTGMAEAGCLTDLIGVPRTPILLWYDQRGAEEAEELRENYEESLTSVSGIRMSNVATIYKLCWLKKHLPEFSGHEMRWFGVPELAAGSLTEKHFTDRTLAIRTGAYSLRTNSWSPEVMGIIGLEKELFPDVINIFQQNFCVSPETAKVLNIPESVRVYIAGHDDMAAAYGAGLTSGIWVDSTGTAEGLIALTESFPPPKRTVLKRMSIAPWYYDGKWALISGVGTSGSLIAELHVQTGLSYAEIDALAAERAGHPDDALLMELTPQRLAKVQFLQGLSDAQKVSAAYDRIISNFRDRAGKLGMFTELPRQLVITGGHALLPELCRRKSEALGGIPFICRARPEAAAYGAALLAQCSSV